MNQRCSKSCETFHRSGARTSMDFWASVTDWLQQPASWTCEGRVLVASNERSTQNRVVSNAKHQYAFQDVSHWIPVMSLIYLPQFCLLLNLWFKWESSTWSVIKGLQ